MGPRLGSAETAMVQTRLLSVRRFNGAVSGERGNSVMTWRGRLALQASMGPRSGERENLPLRLSPSKRFKASWGCAQVSAETR